MDGTYILDGGSVRVAHHTTGYWIGVRSIAEIETKPKKKDVAKAQEAFAKVLQFVASQSGYFGIWTSKGICYYDSVVWATNLQDAMNLGRTYKQIAIWDIAKGVEIAVK